MKIFKRMNMWLWIGVLSAVLGSAVITGCGGEGGEEGEGREEREEEDD